MLPFNDSMRIILYKYNLSRPMIIISFSKLHKNTLQYFYNKYEKQKKGRFIYD
jgi:hypothetical protein